MLAVQFQLSQSQWWPAAELERSELRQLGNLLRHAYNTIPFWRQRLTAAGYDPDAEVTRQWLSTLPVLSRGEVQARGEALVSRDSPSAHGRVFQGQTSGSTGMPITCYQTELTQFFWRAFTVRDHLWHRRNFSGKLAAIRSKVENAVLQGWGPATDTAFVTGPCVVLNIGRDVDAQLAWLREQDPDYVLTHPSNLQALARRALELGVRLARLREARTFGEMLPADLRALCRDAWGVPVTDLYSAEETGYIALQCPEQEHYHVQAEGVLVEILDEHARRCAPGEIGRVVITSLHDFAMPLIRYDIGDYAEAGDSCPCGRGLPVIRRIMGRQRNLVTFPDGRRHWPSLPSTRWAVVAPVRQYQLVQHNVFDIEARLVVGRTLTAAERERLIAVFQELLGYPFQIRLSCVDAIERGPDFKFEDFVSRIGAAGEPH